MSSDISCGIVAVADGRRIFGCFPLQEIGLLAHRTDSSDSIAETISLTTELEMDVVGLSENTENRALIMSVLSSFPI